MNHEIFIINLRYCYRLHLFDIQLRWYDMRQVKIVVRCHDSKDNDEILRIIKSELKKKFKVKPSQELFDSRLLINCLDIAMKLGFYFEVINDTDLTFTCDIAKQYGFKK